jgi:RNA polymerase sigma factor (TIGR02999 family)
MNDVTQILNAIDQGDLHAAERLLPLVYQELRKLAAQRMVEERPGQTLQATALVHEAYLKLLGTSDVRPQWNSRSHFFAAAAEAMRRILINSAHRKRRVKHGGDRQRVDLDQNCSVGDAVSDDLLAVDEALAKLAAEAPVKAELVKLRYFAGLTLEQAADVLQLSPATAKRYWTYARAWLYQEIAEEGPSE